MEPEIQKPKISVTNEEQTKQAFKEMRFNGLIDFKGGLVGGKISQVDMFMESMAQNYAKIRKQQEFDPELKNGIVGQLQKEHPSKDATTINYMANIELKKSAFFQAREQTCAQQKELDSESPLAKPENIPIYKSAGGFLNNKYKLDDYISRLP